METAPPHPPPRGLVCWVRKTQGTRLRNHPWTPPPEPLPTSCLYFYIWQLTPHAKKCNRTTLSHHTKINSRWIKDLNGRPGITRPLEKNTGSTLFDISLNNDFLGFDIKSKINKWDYIKLKSFCTAKETTNIRKRQPNGRKYLQILYLTRG